MSEVLIPIIGCHEQDDLDGTCNDPANIIPECNSTVCPRLSCEVKEILQSVNDE